MTKEESMLTPSEQVQKEMILPLLNPILNKLGFDLTLNTYYPYDKEALLKREPRFLKNVDKTDSCWIWLLGKTPSGYGQISFNRHAIMVHRYSYMLYKGPISKGLVIDHLCNNPSCVNPDHLEAVTTQHNMQRNHNSTRNNIYCCHGHKYTLESTYENRKGHHCCRICKRISDRRLYKLNLKKKQGLAVVT